MNYQQKFRTSLVLLILLLSLLAIPSTLKARQNLPNIVFFNIDDLGYSDIGSYGSVYYETPNIDRLALNGVKFTNAYSASTVCSPTRASILTGKNPGRLHITHAIPIKGHQRLQNTKFLDADYVMTLPLDEITIAEALKDAGYVSASLGKWHVSWEESGYPEFQGFDFNIGGNKMGYQGEMFCPYYGKWRISPNHSYNDYFAHEWNVFSECEEGEYLTDRLTDETINFIKENKGRPFFAYLQHYAVHTPIEAKENLIRKYRQKPVDSLRGHIHPEYAAMIESVDESVGRIVSTLDELGLTDNTIIIFYSDNGGHGNWTSNWPFRGNKGNFYEGGIRVPLIFNWPDKIMAGLVDETPVISYDLYPTILSLLGLPLRPEQHVDGMDFSPILINGDHVERDDALYWHFPNYIGTGHPNPSAPLSVIRDGDWKLIESLEDSTVELFNLSQDIREEHNMAEFFPDKVAELRNKLELWRVKTNVQMPIPNPDYDAERD